MRFEKPRWQLLEETMMSHGPLLFRYYGSGHGQGHVFSALSGKLECEKTHPCDVFSDTEGGAAEVTEAQALRWLGERATRAVIERLLKKCDP